MVESCRGVFCLSLMLGAAAVAGGWTIDSPQPATEVEQTAINEFKSYFRRLVRGKVTVEGKADVVFHIGDTAFAKSKGLDGASLRDEEWVVRSFGTDVVLSGGGTRGVLYAVSHFLEDDCGVRWWYDGDEDVPEPAVRAFGKLDRRGKPHFLSRDIYRSRPADYRTAVRNRLNGNGAIRIPKSWGGCFVTGSPHHCHVFDRYIPWNKYGKDHPEWFSLHGGRRIGGMSRGQLCLTNPEVVDLMEKLVRQSIAQDRERAAKENSSVPLLYDLSMNDNEGYCECPSCAAETAKYGHSGVQLRFANEIARRINADYPELMFSILAYLYSEAVPTGGVRASDRVVVRLCTTGQNMAAGFDEPSNAFYHDQIVGWKNYAKNIFIWDYGTLYRDSLRGFPFASEFHIPAKYRLFAENNVTGIFLGHTEPFRPDLYELKYYLEARMMEDPFRDTTHLIEKFMSEYYGKAGEPILKARKLLDASRRQHDGFVFWFPSYGCYNFVTDDELRQMRALFDEATAIARTEGGAKLEKRVARARMSFDRLWRFHETLARPCPPEKGVSDKPFWDFAVDKDESSYSMHDASGTIMSCVFDADLGGKKAWRIKADEDGYGMPFTMGVYDFYNKKRCAGKSWEKPLGPGYNWYDLGVVDLPEMFLVHFTRTWVIDTPAGAPGMNPGRRRVKAFVKFTGPKYFPGSTESNAIYIARTVFAEP